MFEDARDSHKNSVGDAAEEFHADVAEIIDLMIKDGDATNICRDLDRLASALKKEEITGGGTSE